MKPFCLTALLATVLLTSTAQAQFAGQFTIPTRKVGPITVSLGGYPPGPAVHQQRLRCGTDPWILQQISQPVWSNPQHPTHVFPQTQHPITQQLPQDLRGRWYEVSPQNTHYVYDLRAGDYDMYEVDPATQQVLTGQDGLPIQLRNEPLLYTNGMLTLSPGPDQDGPLMISAPPPQFPLGRTLTPLGGGSPRHFTRRPVKVNATLPGPQQMTAGNVKMVTFNMQGQPATLSQTSGGIWMERNPEETFAFRETGRDERSVYLTRTDGAVHVQIDLFSRLIRVDGRDTHRIDQAF